MAKEKSINIVAKEKRPKITVITPTYNRADFIKETIESVLNQTFEDFEYYILDDGSTDNTKEIVKPYLKDNRVKYLYHSNVGEAETVNWGWSLAKGEYFTQVNSDDPVLPDLFFEMTKVLDKKKNIVVAYPNFYFIDSNGLVIEKIETADWNLQYLLSIYSCECATPGTFIRRITFIDWTTIRDKNFKYIGDTVMYWNMALRGNFFHIDKYLANWRVHNNSISSTRYKSTSEIMIWFKNYFSKHNLPLEVMKCKDDTEISIYSYFISLFKKNNVIGGKNKINYYKIILFYKKFVKNLKYKFRDKSDDPLVSVIIPVYNGENYISNAILSVIAQTYKSIEIIVVNDGSTDNTEKIVKSFVGNIRYFKKENGGVASALNLGIQKSKGKYISWLSHDDEYYPEKISKQIDYLRINKISDDEILYSDYYVLDMINNDSHVEICDIKEKLSPKLKILKLLFMSGLHGCTLLIPKKCFEEVGLFDQKLKTTQDYDLWFKFIDYGYRFRYLNEVLILSRCHKKQDSFKKKSIHEIEVKKLYKDAYNKFFEFIAIQPINIFLQFVKCIEKKNLGDLSNYMFSKRKKFYKFSNLQIGDNDLIGNKFNGYDLHNYLLKKNIESFHLVWNKESFDDNTLIISGDKIDRDIIKQEALKIQKRYCLDSINNPIAYDILYNKYFLETDIAHFHLINNYIFDIQLLPIITRLKPVVWSLHDPWALGGHCIHPYDCNKWKKHCGDCPYLDSHFPLQKDNSALNFVIKKKAIEDSNLDVIVASKWMYKRVKKSKIFKSKKIHLIPFGINQEIFRSKNKVDVKEKMNIPTDAFVITFRCDYSGFKGMDYIEYILKNIKVKTKKIYLLTLATNFENKNERFTCLNYGWVKDDNLLSDIYNASDLFLAPSKADSFGMMVAEAMCCGTLPIVLEGTALPDTVNAPDCGVAVKRDKEEYFKTVQYYIDHEKERNERAKKCLAYAQKKYNKDIYVEEMIKVYEEVIKKHKMTVDDKYLLEQLKKHLMIEPNLGVRENNFCVSVVNKKNKSVIERIKIKFPYKLKRKIKNLILISFYKIDKLCPKKTRRKIKPRLMKYKFVRNYLIKYN